MLLLLEAALEFFLEASYLTGSTISFSFLISLLYLSRLASKFGIPSRLLFLAFCSFISAPLAAGTLYFDPPDAMGCLVIYYFFAEMWFGSLFTVIVEVVDPEVTCREVYCPGGFLVVF